MGELVHTSSSRLYIVNHQALVKQPPLFPLEVLAIICKNNDLLEDFYNHYLYVQIKSCLYIAIISTVALSSKCLRSMETNL